MGPSLSLLLRVLRLISCLSLRRSKPPCCCSPFLRFLVLLLVLAVFRILISGIWRIPIPNGKQPSLMRIRREEGCCQTIGLNCWVLMMWSSLLCRPSRCSILLTQSRIVSPLMATLALLLLPSVVLSTWSSIPVLQVLMSMIPLCVSCFLICALLRGRVSSLHCTLQDLLAPGNPHCPILCEDRGLQESQ